MAHVIVWPKKKFFYPIGNTPPVSFTSSLSHETPAAILLLGCGDPRSILYTVYAELGSHRMLDFTCCDAEPAILARNALLLTMIIDENSQQIQDSVFNIFFHFFLDKRSLALLQKQCQKLVELSTSMESWERGEYSKLLRICSTHTLDVLHQQWALYAATKDLSDTENIRMRRAFQAGMQSVRGRLALVFTAARSAGPLWACVVGAGATHYQRFWDIGVTFDDAAQIAEATFANPIFTYDSSGQEFNVHYGTDPILAFHLAMIANPPLPQRFPCASNLVQIAKQQFRGWCTAFRERVRLLSPNLIIRLYVGDAISFARALHIRTTSNSIDCGLYTSPWEASPIRLNGSGYSSGHQQNRAPVKFDIIDTSNLTDHLGLINILAVTVPLLQKHPVATLYTNTLLSPSEIGGGVAHRACADITTLSLILGIIPVSYVSGFATQTNAHEILMHDDPSRPRQETISWRIAPVDDVPEPVQFGAETLGNILFSIYLKMFSDENLNHIMGDKFKLSFSHYIRASFAALLAVVKQRTRCGWSKTFHHLISLIEKDRTLFTGPNYYQDLCCQLHIHGVGTVGAIADKQYGNFVNRVFKDWEHIPPVVCIVLKVPRNKLAELEGMDADLLGTPILQCEIENQIHHNFFSAVHFFFGRTEPSSSDPHRLYAVEDSSRWHGTSPLIASFYVPSWMLTMQTSATQIRLSIRAGTVRTPHIYIILGPQLSLFSAGLLDEDHVQIAYERPGNLQELIKLRGPLTIKPSSPSQLITIITDQGSTKATGLTGRLVINDTDLQSTFRACPLADITVVQTSPFKILVSFGRGTLASITFPYPVDGNNPKVRIARRSSYIEVDVKLGTSDENGLKRNPFPMVYRDSMLTPWNIHNINLAKSPKQDMSCLEWVPSHLDMTLTIADISTKDNFRGETGLISRVKDTINTMFSGLRAGHRNFVMADSAEPLHGILVFLNCLRLDLPSHTVIGDACVVPYTEESGAIFKTAMRLGRNETLHPNDAEPGLILPPVNSVVRVSQTCQI
ncbi:hypothetical protein H0H87_003127 [Tephrocybe sp. NHM501043]|nr:hypothetical protein H0H87_003127 [Tephrocybe sp. NHM501043]